MYDKSDSQKYLKNIFIEINKFPLKTARRD